MTYFYNNTKIKIRGGNNTAGCQFCNVYLETKTDLDCCTKFKINMTLYEDELCDQEKMKLAITKTHVLEEICSYVKQWIRQITMVNHGAF